MKVPMNASQPNIVFILADDLGYGDLGCYGAKPEHVQTPNIDRIATQGVRFTDCHSPSSVCTPSRYNFMTGRYCWRTWARTGCIWANDPCVIEADRPTIASVLRDGGYETGMVGKWHLGFGSPEDERWDPYRGPDWNRPLSHGPTTCGFDHFFGVPAVGQLPHVFIRDEMVCDLESGDPIRLAPDPRPEYLVEYLDRPRDSNWDLRTQGGKKATYVSEELADHLTREAVAFIDKPHDRPFFLYFAHRNVHGPHDPHPRFRDTSGIGVYGDFIHELDASVGEVLDALESNGLADNTLVIFASDNGATEHHKPVHRVNHNGQFSNGPLRGSKTEVFEGGHRIPLIARWPGHIPPGTQCDHLLALTDMLRTCASLAGVDVPAGAAPDGVDASSCLLRGNDAQAPRETLIHDSFLVVTYAIRHKDWKLIVGPTGGGLIAHSQSPKFGPAGMLFNLRDDLAEETNLYRERPDIVNDLIDRMLAIRGAQA
jgi:arylsulfatase A-like enzyme